MRKEGRGLKNFNSRQEGKSLEYSFSHLTSITTEITADIERCLKWAICTRDAYLKAAYDVMDVVARASAAQAGIRINDCHDNQLLIGRIFETRNVLLDAAFNSTEQQYELPKQFDPRQNP
ncbi:hypothetical protein PG996_005292 [Apiospora saccharicola]|uniref:Uncharacterized protein n=1 Tax=Apiospora saccharicola TaxID=335842 RepID=A0ABR1VPV5_9PEZI